MDFFTKIMEGYLAELRGWPLSYFTNPSNFKTKPDLEAVRDPLIMGSCHFAKINATCLTELKIQRANAKKEGQSAEVSVLPMSSKARPSTLEFPSMTPSGSSSTALIMNIEQERSQQPLPEPTMPINTYQTTFSVDFNMSDYGVLLELYPSSTLSTFRPINYSKL
ncbi:hypothetical protein FRC00_007015 [Tulasnella sp. 408]|nr:hypothetical protein FRC00_007015 [Tulasnella sp. 408]